MLPPSSPLIIDQSVPPSPFHDGERLVQRRAGVAEQAETIGRRSIRPAMLAQHQQFFSARPFMLLGGIDATGQPWATLRAGPAGFVTALDEQTLQIKGGSLPGDPLRELWHKGAAIGGLGIQFETRRRNRVNGVISEMDGDDITVAVSQSFGNCPKYIQSRTPTFILRPPEMARPVEFATKLDASDRAWLARADTFFIATANTQMTAGSARGVDVSHRGGGPGFVRVDDATTLTAPDFTGNNFFNTLGNIASEPRAGLLFVDFQNGDMLYLAVHAEIIWDEDARAAFPLAQRVVRFHIKEIRRSRAALPFEWSGVEYSPYLGIPEAA
jgi:predicted pyridoxine 5'-phosphate oxidase superfamily flavin-nucleotide-binding protein